MVVLKHALFTLPLCATALPFNWRFAERIGVVSSTLSEASPTPTTASMPIPSSTPDDIPTPQNSEDVPTVPPGADDFPSPQKLSSTSGASASIAAIPLPLALLASLAVASVQLF